MASSTKEALGNALKKMLSVKPIDKITVKYLVEECGVNRQTFYYHFDDVYDLLEWVFEEDTNKALPHEIYYDKWRENVIEWFQYLQDNRSFVLNIFNSQNRSYLLRYFKGRLHYCVHSFAAICAEGKNIEWSDLEFVCEFYVNAAIGWISQWFDMACRRSMITTKSVISRSLTAAPKICWQDSRKIEIIIKFGLPSIRKAFSC